MKALFLASLAIAQVASAAEVAPQAMWYDGLEKIQGRFQYIQIASPGGLWLEETRNGKQASTQIALKDVPEPLRSRLQKAEIEIRLAPGSSVRKAEQAPTPGQRGQPPYHGHSRRYDETAHGQLVVRGLPGVGLESGDAGEYSGAADFHLYSICHSDPSDVGMLQERLQGEMIWGGATLSRNYASLDATQRGLGSPDAGSTVLANARLLRGGKEIVAYIEWMDPAPPAGITQRRVRGSVRLFRAP